MPETAKKKPVKRKDDGIEEKLKKMIQKEIVLQKDKLLYDLEVDLSDVLNEAVRSERRNFLGFLTFISIGLGCLCLACTIF